MRELFGTGVSRVEARRASFVFRYRSAEHWLAVFRRYYGPVHKAFEALGDDKREELAAEIVELLQRNNRAHDALVVPSEYLEIVLEVA